MRTQGNMFQMIEQIKCQKDLHEMKVSNLSDKEFKIIVIKMFNKLQRRMEEHTENFNKDIEYIRNTKLKNIITKLKNKLEGFHN